MTPKQYIVKYCKITKRRQHLYDNVYRQTVGAVTKPMHYKVSCYYYDNDNNKLMFSGKYYTHSGTKQFVNVTVYYKNNLLEMLSREYPPGYHLNFVEKINEY